jgi:leucyl aminopeptidase
MVPRLVLVSTTTQEGSATDADTVAIGIFEGAAVPANPPAELEELLASGEARASFKSLALLHAGGTRWLIVGLGKQEQLSAERMRVAAAVAVGRAKELATRALCWEVPTAGSEAASTPELAAALVEGTILADYRFDRFRSEGGDEQSDEPRTRLERLVVAAPGEDPDHLRSLTEATERGVVGAERANAARDLQNRPGNDLTPGALAEHARELSEQIDLLSVEVEGREGILAHSMGAFGAVAQGSDQEPALITLRYEPPAATGSQGGEGRQSDTLGGAGEGLSQPDAGLPVLGLVGKAITFDSGGISLKPGAKMSEMKFDMSGGAAVIEAIAGIAQLRLPLNVIGVVGATENLPSGHAVKPGDIVTASNGKTIEVNNTDAEGRLVLADCLYRAVALGAQRIVDLATLTGAVIVALGSTYAGLMANDEELADRIVRAGEQTGEIAWQLPLHEEYEQLIKGRYGDLDNAPEDRKAGTIVAGTFLSNFVDEVPWAHLDIAGSAWDLGRAYAPKGAAGYGVRLLIALARSYCQPT